MTCGRSLPCRALPCCPCRAKVRPKRVCIEAVDLVPGQPHYASLTLRTQAGAYVKEFCHGDWGRTRPCLGDLLGGVHAEIVQLDVLAVHMPDWP